MVKTLNAQNRQEIKAYLETLLDGSTGLDAAAIEAAFWARLRQQLTTTNQS